MTKRVKSNPKATSTTVENKPVSATKASTSAKASKPVAAKPVSKAKPEAEKTVVAPHQETAQVVNEAPLHENEQQAQSTSSDNTPAFEFRFWDLGEMTGKAQGIEVGHDGAPIDLFVLDEANFEAFKTGQIYQYVGGFGISAARHLFQIPFDGKWFLAARANRAGDTFELAYRLMDIN